MAHVHSTHPQVLLRLKRAYGHLARVIEMIEEEKDCLLVAQQLQAVNSAIGNAKTVLVQDHIEHCLQSAMDNSAGDRDALRKHLRGFKEIARYL